MSQFLHSYPKRAFANPIIHFAEDVDQRKSYIYCFSGSEMSTYTNHLPEKNEINRVILSQVAR